MGEEKVVFIQVCEGCMIRIHYYFVVQPKMQYLLYVTIRTLGRRANINFILSEDLVYFILNAYLVWLIFRNGAAIFFEKTICVKETLRVTNISHLPTNRNIMCSSIQFRIIIFFTYVYHTLNFKCANLRYTPVLSTNIWADNLISKDHTHKNNMLKHTSHS